VAVKSSRAKTRLSVLDHKLKTQRYCDWATTLHAPDDTETPLWFVSVSISNILTTTLPWKEYQALIF
jgi:hypothetical protein